MGQTKPSQIMGKSQNHKLFRKFRDGSVSFSIEFHHFSM